MEVNLNDPQIVGLLQIVVEISLTCDMLTARAEELAGIGVNPACRTEMISR